LETAEEHNRQSRLRRLTRYHIENFFLDEDLAAKVFRELACPDSTYCDPARVKQKIIEIARSRVGYAVALVVDRYIQTKPGLATLIPSGCHSMSKEALRDAMAQAARDHVASGSNLTFDALA
jgi:hypothetical protein